MAPTCFGLRPSSGSLQLSLEVISILRHSVKLLFGGVATCPSVLCALCAVQNNNFTECLNINITSARLNCKLPDDDRRPKHVGAI